MKTAYELKRAVMINNNGKYLIPEIHLDNHLRPDILGFNKSSLTTFAYEVKVDKNDLLKDEKMFEYAKYVNYTYLVVTKQLADLAVEKVKNTDIGVIVPYCEGKITRLSSYKKVKKNNTPILNFDEVEKKCLYGAYWKMFKEFINKPR